MFGNPVKREAQVFLYYFSNNCNKRIVSVKSVAFSDSYLFVVEVYHVTHLLGYHFLLVNAMKRV